MDGNLEPAAADAAKTGEWLLRLRDIGLSRNGRHLLDRVHLTVAPREIVTLIGPNGAGKTLLVRIALGLTAPDQGAVERRPGLVVGYMPQHFHVEESLPLTARRFLQLAKGASADGLHAAAAEVGIARLLDQPLPSLSGGELQRALLARAILRQPQLLVLDEPARGVDIAGQLELYDLIARLRHRLGCGVLMVSHDLHLVMAATDQVVCLNRHICCHGRPDAVSAHPEYLALFGPLPTERLAVYQHRHDHRHDLHGEVVDERAAHAHPHA
jgi:zinc transport system ATP-binding protein